MACIMSALKGADPHTTVCTDDRSAILNKTGLLTKAATIAGTFKTNQGTLSAYILLSVETSQTHQV